MIVMCITILNNYLEGILKKLQKQYRWVGKYIQTAMLNVILGIVLGKIAISSGRNWPDLAILSLLESSS